MPVSRSGTRDRHRPASKSCAGRRLLAEALGEKSLLRGIAPPLDLAALGLSDHLVCRGNAARRTVGQRRSVCGVDAVVTGATRRGLLIGFELPGSSHLMGDDSWGMQEREQPAPRPGNSPEITSALLGFRALVSYFFRVFRGRSDMDPRGFHVRYVLDLYLCFCV